MSITNKKAITLATSATLTAGLALSSTLASADTSNPFAFKELSSGYMQLAEGKCGEAKCGSNMKKKAEKMKEAKCGEGKCGEAKCGADMKEKAEKATEGKCGEAKCGADMKDKAKKAVEGKCGEGKCGSSN